MINKSSAGYCIGFMGLVCMVFGAGVAVVHYATLDTMKKNEALLRNKRLASAFMIEPAEKTAQAFEDALRAGVAALPSQAGAWEAYRKTAPPDSGAIGFVFSGIGFWDVIGGILVLSPDLSRIVNIEFLSQSETPGLGARIEEPWFKRQFQGLTIDWNAKPDQRIIIGASPNAQARNRVDAITGATQTSLALMKTLNAQLEEFRRWYAAANDPPIL